MSTLVQVWYQLQKKKALDVFRAKVLTTPEKTYIRKYGVVLTKIIEDGIAVDVTIEGGYLARSYLLGSMNSTYLDLLAYQSKKKCCLSEENSGDKSPLFLLYHQQ